MSKEKKNIILNTENLSIGFKTKKKDIVVASNINFELEQGQLIGLVGANGIGKSTLLRTLIKVQPSLTGSIFLNKKILKETSTIDLAKQLSIVLTEQSEVRLNRLKSVRTSTSENVSKIGKPDTPTRMNTVGKTSTTPLCTVTSRMDGTIVSAMSQNSHSLKIGCWRTLTTRLSTLIGAAHRWRTKILGCSKRAPTLTMTSGCTMPTMWGACRPICGSTK